MIDSEFLASLPFGFSSSQLEDFFFVSHGTLAVAVFDDAVSFFASILEARVASTSEAVKAFKAVMGWLQGVCGKVHQEGTHN